MNLVDVFYASSYYDQCAEDKVRTHHLPARLRSIVSSCHVATA